jgi:hypothetical protein
VSEVPVGSHPGRRTMGPTGTKTGAGIRLAWLRSIDGSWPGVGVGSGPAVHVGFITRRFPFGPCHADDKFALRYISLRGQQIEASIKIRSRKHEKALAT